MRNLVGIMVIMAVQPAFAAPSPPLAPKLPEGVAATVQGVPALVFKTVPPKAWEQAWKRFKRGRYLKNRKKRAKAEAAFIDVLKAQPGFMRARYQLAALRMASGKPEDALALLAQLATSPYVGARRVAVKAAKDWTFRKLRKDKRFKALMAVPTGLPKGIDFKKEAVAVAGEMFKGSANRVLADQAKGVRNVHFVWTEGDGPDNWKAEETNVVYDPTKIPKLAFWTQRKTEWMTLKKAWCPGRCCSFRYDGACSNPKYGYDLRVRQVCFWPSADGKTATLDKVVVHQSSCYP